MAAASHMQIALQEAVERFAATGRARPRVSYASTGNLQWRIDRGEPFELFLAADERFVFELYREGLAEDRGTVYAQGRLAIVSPPGAAVDPAAGLDGLREALERGEIRRFAIADPEAAPYGMAARDLLERARLWGGIEPRLVYGENAARAARLALSPRNDGGIVAWPLVAGTRYAELVRYQILPPGDHAPLRHRMVLLRGAGDDARDFYRFLLSERGRAIFARHGLEAP